MAAQKGGPLTNIAPPKGGSLPPRGPPLYHEGSTHARGLFSPQGGPPPNISPPNVGAAPHHERVNLKYAPQQASTNCGLPPKRGPHPKTAPTKGGSCPPFTCGNMVFFARVLRKIPEGPEHFWHPPKNSRTRSKLFWLDGLLLKQF